MQLKHVLGMFYYLCKNSCSGQVLDSAAIACMHGDEISNCW